LFLRLNSPSKQQRFLHPQPLSQHESPQQSSGQPQLASSQQASSPQQLSSQPQLASQQLCL
jgi:hypothetical protein